MAHSAHTHDKSSTSEELVVRVNHEDRFAQVYRAPLAGGGYRKKEKAKIHKLIILNVNRDGENFD